jgi:plasmid stabilization system protein ParE
LTKEEGRDVSYNIKYLPSALDDLLDIEDYLDKYSLTASDKFTAERKRLTGNLEKFPFMCRAYEYDDYFRCMVLAYEYLLFYHVSEDSKDIEIHRIIHGIREVDKLLRQEK